MASIGFPPEPVFPNAIDSDRTLFLVYNSTESILAVDNEPWCTEIEITPVLEDDDDFWADNGFGNIDGELFYYDSVEKDSNGKVSKLLKCARNLGGIQTHFVKSGGSNCQVRSFVVAEHHNQLVKAICQVEKFVGFNFDTDTDTLDFRIRCLREVPICQDDFNCPVVTFKTSVVDDDPCDGILIDYEIDIDGDFSGVLINFGDGITTDTIVAGQHRYPPGVSVDPVVTVTSTNCQICATPSEREGDNTLCAVVVPEPFTIPIPEVTLPNISFTIPEIPAPQVELPPVILPCVELSVPEFPEFPEISIPDFPGISISIPDIDIQIPSVITIVPDTISIVPNEITISPSVIEFGNVPFIPTQIAFVNNPTITSTITWINNPTITSVISWAETPVIPDVSWATTPVIPDVSWAPTPTIPDVGWAPTPSISDVQFADAPVVSVEWGTPPDCSCTVVIECPATSIAAGMNAKRNSASAAFDEDWSNLVDSWEDNDEDNLKMQMDLNNIGIPSEIKVIAPERMPDVKVFHDIPDVISVEFPKIPTVINVEHDIPHKIELIDKLPEFIKLEVPGPIKIDASDLPALVLELSDNFPSVFKLEAIGIPDKIQVEGIPDTIAVLHDIPDVIELILPGDPKVSLVMPDNPKIEMVYEGAPIEMKVKLGVDTALGGDDDDNPCVMIVPCNK